MTTDVPRNRDGLRRLRARDNSRRPLASTPDGLAALALSGLRHAEGGMNPRTAVRDAILSGVSAELDRDAARGVEWAAVSDTVAAVRRREAGLEPQVVDFETYREVAL